LTSAVRSPRVARLGGLAVLAVVAWLLPYQLNVYWISVADIAILFALLAVGMGLVMGVAGQVNLAQIAFYGVGAYATAILTTHDGYGFWTAAALAMVATALTGVVVGTPALRVQSHYLGIVTLGLAVAFTDWITNAPVTGGDSGISGIPTPPLFGINLSSQYLYYYLELIVLAAGLAFGLFIVHTPLGRRMRAMRDDPLAASAAGTEIRQLRMIAFVLASVYGGAAGVLYAGMIGYIAPETFSIADMFLLLAMVIIGGRAHHRAAGADQPRRLRAARLRSRGSAGRGVRPRRAGRDSPAARRPVPAVARAHRDEPRARAVPAAARRPSRGRFRHRRRRAAARGIAPGAPVPRRAGA
jgi:branched-chain amino acid transport system permease protein